MKRLLNGSASKKQGGIISEDILHKIDMMENEAESDQQAYKARRRKNLDDSQLFDDNVYESEESDDSEGGSYGILGVFIGMVAVMVVIIVVTVALPMFK